MHCKACNVSLSDFESTRQDDSGEHTDLCNACYSYTEDELPAMGRIDLITDADNIQPDNMEVLLSYYDVDVVDRGTE